jgi:gliding motility-associated-like protein
LNKGLIILLFLIEGLFASSAYSQTNLITNPSFEYSHGNWPCPANPADSFPWPNYWITPTWGNPDYLSSNVCGTGSNIPQNYAGFQYPYNGDAYMLIGVVSDATSPGDGYREYIQSKINQNLETGHTYCFSAWLSLCDSTPRATDDIGAFFSDTAISRDDIKNFPFTPQIRNPEGRFITDNKTWTLFSGSFIASGGEQYITIGNFLDDSQTTIIFISGSGHGIWISVGAYYIDIVSLYDCTGFNYTADAGENVSVCLGDSISIGTDEASNRQYSWWPKDGLSDSTAARPRAAPLNTTAYVLTVIDEYIQQTTDTIIVTVDTTCGSYPVYVANIFSPNGDGNNDVLYLHSQFVKEISYKVYNRWGNLVFESSDVSHGWDGRYKNKDCPEGVYFYVAEVTFVDGNSVVKKGNVTLVR